MITLSHLSKTLGNQNILSDVSFTITSGERLIILGQNGAGKTTLIRCILGEYQPSSGEVRVLGFAPFKNRVRALEHIAFVPQLPPPLRYTVKELFDYCADVTDCDRNTIRSYCDYFELDVNAHIHKPFYKLSGGMKQKVLISIAFARSSPILIFDEPTANLDVVARDRFRSLLSDNRCRDKTMIFISHRIEEVSNVVKRSIELDLGKVVKDVLL
ncbi:MAG: ABC transporter ATP-binding protein [Burkholderiales bacterium]|jgi:ABC-2 type transport system ATP-binding protein|nr:ABC transporter ATP-binding protein [Burkholderiales bacterium]